MGTQRAWVTRSPIAVVLGAVVVGLVLLVGSAHALHCADPDGDGSITEADGLITVAAAAGADTACSLTTCDINTDGRIDDTDAVLVFRKAAEFEVEDDCLQTTGGPVDQRVVILVRRVLPFLQVPFQFVPQIGGLPTPDPNDPTLVNCDNFGDGEINTSATESEISIDFSECLFGNTFFDGSVLDGERFEVDLTVIDNFTEDEIGYFAEALQVMDTGMALRISGTFIASPFFDSFILEDADDFVLKLFNLGITPGSSLLTGRATLDLADALLPDLQRIVLEFDGTNFVVVTVTDDNITTTVFLYDLATERFL